MVASTPIAAPRTWLHIPTGAYWLEKRLHRGRIVLGLYGRVGHEIRLAPPEHPSDDEGGPSRLGAPNWIQRTKQEALERTCA